MYRQTAGSFRRKEDTMPQEPNAQPQAQPIDEEAAVQEMLRKNANYMAPFIHSKEEAKEYLGYLKPLYQSMGVTLTEEKTEEILNREPSPDISLAEDIQRIRLDQFRARLRHSRHDAEDYYDHFSRVYDAMLKPENTPENIAYNNDLSEKAKTKDGQKEIMLEAANMIADADPGMLTTDTTHNLQSLKSNFSLFNLMFLNDHLKTMLSDMVKSNELQENDPLIAKFNSQRTLATNSATVTNHSFLMMSPFLRLLPEGYIPEAEVLAQMSSKDAFWGADMPQQAFGQMINELGRLAAFGTGMSLIGDALKKATEEKVKAEEGYQIGKLFANGQTVVDEKGQPVPKDSYPEVGKNYLVINSDGRVRGFRLKNDPNNIDFDIFDAKLPDSLTRSMGSFYLDQMKFLQRESHLSDEISGVFGPEVHTDGKFSDLVPNLSGVNYQLPEGISAELAECLTFGSLLDPARVQNMKTSSTMAGIGVSQLTNSLALDWIGNNDKRFEGAESALIEVRNGMPKLLQDVANGNLTEAKAAFSRVAETFALAHLEFPSTNLKDSNSLIDLAMCTKLANIIRENPHQIADGMDEFVKTSILAKANANAIFEQGARAAAELLNRPNLSADQKRELLTRVAVAGRLDSLRAQSVQNPDITAETERLNAELGDAVMPGMGSGYSFLVAAQDRLNQKARLHFPTDADLALAQNPGGTYDAVKATVSPEEIENLINLPPEVLADSLKKLQNHKVNPASVTLPAITALKPADPDAVLADLKETFVSETISSVRALPELKETTENQSAVTGNGVLGSKRCGALIEMMTADLNRTPTARFGPSKEFLAVSDALGELRAANETNLDSGRVKVLADKLIEAGTRYLSAKEAEGITAATGGNAGERYKNVQNILKRADWVSKIAAHTNEKALENTDYADKNVMSVKDCAENSALLDRLKAARNFLDDADPFFYKSSAQYKEIQQTLNDCIGMLSDFGIKEMSSSRLSANLSALEAEASTYTITRADPNTAMGIVRMAAVESVLKAVKGSSEMIAAQQSARQEQRNAVREQAGIKAEAANMQKAYSEKEGASVNEFMKLSNSYKSFTLKSKKFDPAGKTANLARRIRLNAEYLTNVINGNEVTYTKECNTIKGLLADRMIADMIVKERAEHKDAAFEKAYIQNPNSVKKALLNEPQIGNLMNVLLINGHKEYAASRRLDTYKNLQTLTEDTLETVRENLTKNAPEAKAPEKAAEAEMQQNSANAFIPQ